MIPEEAIRWVPFSSGRYFDPNRTTISGPKTRTQKVNAKCLCAWRTHAMQPVHLALPHTQTHAPVFARHLIRQSLENEPLCVVTKEMPRTQMKNKQFRTNVKQDRTKNVHKFSEWLMWSILSSEWLRWTIRRIVQKKLHHVIHVSDQCVYVYIIFCVSHIRPHRDLLLWLNQSSIKDMEYSQLVFRSWQRRQSPCIVSDIVIVIRSPSICCRRFVRRKPIEHHV